MNRRSFLASLAAVSVGATAFASGAAAARAKIKPRRLRPGDSVTLVSPATPTWSATEIDIARESLEALGLRVRLAEHLLARRGYLAGADRDRAADINAAFADPAIGGVIALRGGWGSARILPYLDYGAIAAHPKVLLGFSDVTALHMAIQARTGLVTFHGPVGISSWTPFTVASMKRVLFDAEAVTFENLKEAGDTLTPVQYRTRTITPGAARGRLLGGNLAVLTAIMGSPYLPDWDGAILFLEDVDEQLYRIDRMLTELSLAGVLKKVRGVVFGSCTDCTPGEGYGSLTLEEILEDHIKPLGVPAWHGAMIGHGHPQFTLGEGIDVEIDAARATIRMLEPAVE